MSNITDIEHSLGGDITVEYSDKSVSTGKGLFLDGDIIKSLDNTKSFNTSNYISKDPITGRITDPAQRAAVGEVATSQCTIRTLRNLHAANSERVAATNSTTTPAPTYGVSIPTNPLGCLTGTMLGTSGFAQQNYTVPADTAWYVFSFLAYVAPGTSGAQVHLNAAFSGGENLAFTYDWDNPLTASTNVYVPQGSGASRSVQVDDLGNGFRRFHLTLQNNGKTVMYTQMQGTSATTKAVITGLQIVRIPDDGTSLRVDKYLPVGQKAAPYTTDGGAGYGVDTRSVFPFSKIAIYSDSIWGSAAGTAVAGAWRMTDSVLEYFGRCELNIYSGNTTSQVCGYFDSANTGGYFARYLVIFNCGRNDAATLVTQSGRDSVLARLRQSITAIGHQNYMVIGVFARYTCTASPGSEENTMTNVSIYNGIIAYNMMLKAEFGNRFVDVQSISVNSYNPLSTSDANAYALGMRPPSISPPSGDGLHPNATENQLCGRAVVQAIRQVYGDTTLNQ